MNDNTINQCEVVQDLLPLYQDDICSASSKKMIESHLSGCESCTKFMQRLQSTHVEEHLAAEKNSVLGAHVRKERKKTFTIGICTAAILMIPVIICLICNLAIGHALDWFFIVLTALLLTASVTVIPLVMQDHTVLWTMGCFTVTLLLLLFTICLYTRGNWFFLAAIPTLFGLSLLFMPYVIRHIPLPKFLARSKALLVMLWDTVWLYAVIVICGIYTAHPDYWRIALEITTFCLPLPWGLFLIIRYGKSGAFIKAGICSLFAGIFSSTINHAITLILREPARFLWNADFTVWNSAAVDAVTSIAILAVTIPLGIALIAAGIFARNAKKS